MKTRTKVVSSALGVLLLATAGGSLALWSDKVVGNDIVANTGHLDVAMTDSTSWDVSKFANPQINDNGTAADPTDDYFTWTDRTAAPFPITDITTWYLVPGDTIRVAAPVDVDVKGQNIAARLDVTFPGTVTPLVDIDNDGTPEISIANARLVEATDANAAVLAVAGSGAATYLFTESTNNMGSGSKVWAVFDVTFDDTDETGIAYGKTPGDAQTDVDAMDILLAPIVGAVSATLTQVRS